MDVAQRGGAPASAGLSQEDVNFTEFLSAT
jgi:hypothetical protein